MSFLFHRDVLVAPLGSGSKGNCTWVGDHRSGVLIDCGISTRQIFERLASIGLSDVHIDAVLITHEHSDHIGAARILDKRVHHETGRRIPFYMTPGTRQNLPDRCTPQHIIEVRSGQSIALGARTARAWSVPHDTADPIAWTVDAGDTTVGVITDLGSTTRLVEGLLASCRIAVLEFNHDIDMLMQGAYPWQLKQRVRGRHGHLSNRQAGALLRAGASSTLEHLVLAHLSEENNTPDLAHATAEQAIAGTNAHRATIHIAQQRTAIGPLSVTAPMTPSPSERPRKRPGTKAKEPTAALPVHQQPTLF